MFQTTLDNAATPDLRSSLISSAILQANASTSGPCFGSMKTTSAASIPSLRVSDNLKASAKSFGTFGLKAMLSRFLKRAQRLRDFLRESVFV